MRKLIFLSTLILPLLFLVLKKYGLSYGEKTSPELQALLQDTTHCSQKIPTSDTLRRTQICIPKRIHDFGKVPSQNLRYQFEFFNEGADPLITYYVKGSGGDTPSKYPKKPIPPGGKGVLEVIWGAQKRAGKGQRIWWMKTNTEPEISVFRIKAELVKPKD